VLRNQFPLAVSPLKAIGLAHHKAFRIASLQHDVHFLDRANEANVAVHDDVRFEDIYLAGWEMAEPLSKLSVPAEYARRKRWDDCNCRILAPNTGCDQQNSACASEEWRLSKGRSAR
jgi:hypothetical protein